MARKKVHEYLEEIADTHELRGKGEAVTFAVYLTMALVQQIFTDSYHRDRDVYAP